MIDGFIARFACCPFSAEGESPWGLTQRAETLVARALGDLSHGYKAVIAPGALIEPGTVVGRLSLVDQHPLARLSPP